MSLGTGSAVTTMRQHECVRSGARKESASTAVWPRPKDGLGNRVCRQRRPDCTLHGAASVRRTSSGFTLLETLIALVVLSVGALGCVALQLKALQATHSAYQRSLASLIAADAGERLWAGLATGQIDTGWLPEWVQHRDCAGGNPHVCLPELAVRIEGAAERRVVSVSWVESRFQDAEDGRARLDYVFELLPERPS